jgi:hypothetical protein
MILPVESRRVLVRKQGSPFLATLVGHVCLDVPDNRTDPPGIRPGSPVAMAILDDRGFEMFAQTNQLEDATAEHEELYKVDLTPRLIGLASHLA